jgi:hypothetical protein
MVLSQPITFSRVRSTEVGYGTNEAHASLMFTSAGDTTSFAEQIAPLRAVAPRKLRYVFVTATLPQQTAEELVTQWPDMALASGPGLHRTAAGVCAYVLCVFCVVCKYMLKCVFACACTCLCVRVLVHVHVHVRVCVCMCVCVWVCVGGCVWVWVWVWVWVGVGEKCKK